MRWVSSVLAASFAAAAARAQVSPLACVAGFGALGFDLSNFSRYGEYFDGDSVLAVAQAGAYTGREAIEEYARFVSSASPYFDSARQTVLGVSFTGVNETSGLCTFLMAMSVTFTPNPELALPVNFTAVLTNKVEYDPMANIIRKDYVFFADASIEFLFSTILRTTQQAAQFICGVLATQCRDVFDLNALASVQDCEKRMKALPVLSPGSYFDGYDFGCRALHAVFAAKNPTHCAHISFIPLEDPNGDIKCQVSKRTSSSDFFTDSDLAFAANLSALAGIDYEKGFSIPCEDSRVWLSEVGCDRDCGWVAEDPTARCATAGAAYSCAATCLPECKSVPCAVERNDNFL